MRVVPFAAVLLSAALALGGCGDSVDRLDGDAAPVGALSSPSAVPAPSVSTSPSATASATATASASAKAKTTAAPTKTTSRPTVFGSHGLGALQLGMTRKQAEATGVVVAFKGQTGSGCSQPTHLRGASGITAGDSGMVYYSGSLGIEIIDAYGSVRTPEGIKLGSSLAALKRTYPEWADVTGEGAGETGRGYADVAGNAKARWRIATVDSRVAELTLQFRNQDCYE